VPGRLGEQLGDIYTLLLAAGMVIGTVLSNVHRHPAPATQRAPQSATLALLVAIVLLAAGAVLLGLAALGPISAGAPAQTWQLSTPGNRGGWLLPRLGVLLGGTAGVGAVLGGLLELALGAGLAPPGHPSPGRAGLGWGVSLGALLAAALAAAAVAGQPGAGRWSRGPQDGRAVRVAGRGLLGLGVAGGVLALVLAHRAADRVAALPVGVVIGAVVLAAVVLGAGTTAAVRALGGLDRAALSSGADLTGSAMASVVGMDPTVLASAVQERRLRQRGRVRRRRWRATTRRGALLEAEIRRVSRHPAALALAAGLVLLPYLAEIVLSAPLVTLVRVLAAYLAANAVAGGLRTVCRSAALRRTLGGTDLELRLTHLIVPAVAAALFLLATMPAGRSISPSGHALLLAALTGAVYRTASRQPVEYDAAWATSPMGPVPAGLIGQVLRGPDFALVVAAVTGFWPA
jgi:hypothetical protein